MSAAISPALHDAEESNKVTFQDGPPQIEKENSESENAKSEDDPPKTKSKSSRKKGSPGKVKRRKSQSKALNKDGEPQKGRPKRAIDKVTQLLQGSAEKSEKNRSPRSQDKSVLSHVAGFVLSKENGSIVSTEQEIKRKF